jgi:hypothetical protein
VLFAHEFVAKIATLPDWERDAIRRLLEGGRLTDHDRDELYELLLAENDCSDSNPPPKAHPVDVHDLRREARDDELFLASITAVRACNGLPKDSTLEFDPAAGLNVVFGRNATGKSSFARLLRVTGKARVIPAILPDVMSKAASIDIDAQARFTIQRGGRRETIDWKWGDHTTGLSSVAVFDRDCSISYVDQGNVAEFLPGGLDIFAELVELRKILKARCEADAASMRAKSRRVPDFGWSTTVGEIVFGWGGWGRDPADDEKRLTELANWTDGDARRLGELEESVGTGRKRQVEEIRRITQAERQVENLTGLESSLDQLARQLRIAAAEMVTLADRRASVLRDLGRARLARAESLTATTDPHSRLLDGSGSPEWLALWDAAATFSLNQAYPGQAFPNVGPVAHCVLCQRQIDSEASAVFLRLNELANHVRPGRGNDDGVGRLEDDLKAVELQIDRLGNAIGTAAVGVRARLEILPATDQTLEDVRTVLISLSDAALIPAGGVISEEDARDRLLKLADDAERAIQIVASHRAEIESTVGVSLEDIDTFAQEVEDPELLELRDRKALSTTLSAVLAYSKNEARRSQLESLASSLSITQLTSMSKKLAASLVTDRLVEALGNQLKAAGLDYLTAQIVTSGRAGVTTIRLAPPSAAFKKLGMSEVLSEGEQALLALAAFFAELDVAGHNGPIVLDDPVTGLDSENKSIIAERLAKAAEDRQVIVFTHDEEFAQRLSETAEFWGVRMTRSDLGRAE